MRKSPTNPSREPLAPTYDTAVVSQRADMGPCKVPPVGPTMNGAAENLNWSPKSEGYSNQQPSGPDNYQPPINSKKPLFR